MQTKTAAVPGAHSDARADDHVHAFAPAKINLTLHVEGRRADGYHLLDSLVIFAGVGDAIVAAPASGFSLTITGPFAAGLSADEDNLVLRAARHLAARAGISSGVHLTLEKNLPVASGIGGGSSDAAATLIACAALWRADLSALDDAGLASALGADVPVCLRRRATFMSGIGEMLAPVPALPGAWLVLVNPQKPLATKDVFGALKGRYSPAMDRARYAGLGSPAALAAAVARDTNDLMAPARELMPDIGAVLDTLTATPGCLLARMSGSGPTCFGLYPDRETATAAAVSVTAKTPGWWVVPAPFFAES